MAVTANEHNTSNCLNSISGSYGDDGNGNPLYSVDVNISYIGDSSLHGNCNTLSNTVVTEKSPLSIIVDAFVRYPDLDHPNSHNKTYHRRSLQKI